MARRTSSTKKPEPSQFSRAMLGSEAALQRLAQTSLALTWSGPQRRMRKGTKSEKRSTARPCMRHC
eukprot:5391391-Amphidinium_carterae.1